MESQNFDTPRMQTSESVRWMTYSGVSKILSSGDWLTLKGLMEIEARLAGLDGAWAATGLGEWFKVRVGQELTFHTGLTPGKQRTHIRNLEYKWNLIETRIDPKRTHTQVRFVKRTIEALAHHCIPRLACYQGGICGAREVHDKLYFWIRPDIQGYGWYWDGKGLLKMIETSKNSECSGPVDEELKAIMDRGPFD